MRFSLSSLLDSPLRRLARRKPSNPQTFQHSNLSHVSFRKPFLFALFLFAIFVPGISHAQSSIGDTATRFFATVLDIFTVLNWLILGMVQAVLDPDVIFGKAAASGVRPMEIILQNIWVLSRDIVNTIFAFLLIIGALMMILQGKMEVIKQRAPKFILAVILVNFSWFFPRVILDVSNVLTAVIYQIPNLVGSATAGSCILDYGPNGVLGGGDDVPCKYVYRVMLFPPTPEQCGAPTNPPLKGCPPPVDDPTAFPNWGKQFGGLVNIYWYYWDYVMKNGGINIPTVSGLTIVNHWHPASGAGVILNGLAVNFARMPQLARMQMNQALNAAGVAKGAAKASTYLQFFIVLVFHTLIAAAVGLLLLAMLGVFIVRIGMIWLCVAFMPFVFVGYAMKGTFGDMGIEGVPNIWKIFTKFAFLPAMVAVPLAVGFTLLSQAPLISGFAASDYIGGVGIEGLDQFLGINSLHQLLWLAITLGIMWIGTFKVLETSGPIASKFVGSVKGVGEGALKFGMNTLGYAPILPMPGGKPGEKGSVFGMRDVLRRGAGGRGANEIMDFFGNKSQPTTGQINNAVQTLKNQNGDQTITQMKNAGAGNDPQLIAALQRLAKDLENTGQLQPGQADQVLTNKDIFREVLEEGKKTGLIKDDAEKNSLETKFNPIIDKIKTATGKVDLADVKSTNGKDVNIKIVAQKADTSLATPGISLDDVKKSLELQRDIQITADEREAIQKIITAIQGETTAAGAQGKLAPLK